MPVNQKNPARVRRDRNSGSVFRWRWFHDQFQFCDRAFQHRVKRLDPKAIVSLHFAIAHSDPALTGPLRLIELTASAAILAEAMLNDLIGKVCPTLLIVLHLSII